MQLTADDLCILICSDGVWDNARRAHRHPAQGLIGEVAKTFTLRTVEEIRGACEVHTRFAKQPKKHPHSADMAAALKFAGMHLAASQGGKR